MSASDQSVATEELGGHPRFVTDPVLGLSVPGGAFINGSWQLDNLSLPVTDPEDGRLLGYVADSTPADVAAAVSGVQESLATEDWPLWARSESLHQAARLLAQASARFAHLIASEGVKTIAEAEREVARCVETLRLSAEAGSVLTGETIPFARAGTVAAGSVGSPASRSAWSPRSPRSTTPSTWWRTSSGRP